MWFFFILRFDEKLGVGAITTAYNNCKVKLATLVEGDPKAPFPIATAPKDRGGR